MKIYNNINNLNFFAKKNVLKMTTKQKEYTFAKPPKSLVKDDFFADIENYMNGTMSKEQYLKTFLDKVKNHSYDFSQNRLAEKYKNDLLTDLDFAYSFKNISDKHLTEEMIKLLKSKNS